MFICPPAPLPGRSYRVTFHKCSSVRQHVLGCPDPLRPHCQAFSVSTDAGFYVSLSWLTAGVTERCSEFGRFGIALVLQHLAAALRRYAHREHSQGGCQQQRQHDYCLESRGANRETRGSFTGIHPGIHHHALGANLSLAWSEERRGVGRDST